MMASISQGLLVALFLSSLARSHGWDAQLGTTAASSVLETLLERHQCARSQPRYASRCYAELMNQSLHCEDDLLGVGSLDTLCTLTESVMPGANLSIVGTGTLEISHNVSLSCAGPGCEILILLAGNLVMGANSTIRGGTLTIQAANVTVGAHGSIDATSLAGKPPAQTSGTPQEAQGAGGGHGGRGASCEVGREDEVGTWGGDMYNWEKLSKPWVYGSRGGTTRDEASDLGGGGGGRIAITVEEVLLLAGSIEANGGSVGKDGGGGSGGSVMVAAQQM